MRISKLLPFLAGLAAANPLTALFAPITQRSKTCIKDPVSNRISFPKNTNHTTSPDDEPEVTDEEFDNFKYWVQYAAAAYCNYDKQPGELISCGDNQCVDVEANGGTIVQTVVFVSPPPVTFSDVTLWCAWANLHGKGAP